MERYGFEYEPFEDFYGYSELLEAYDGKRRMLQ